MINIPKLRQQALFDSYSQPSDNGYDYIGADDYSGGGQDQQSIDLSPLRMSSFFDQPVRQYDQPDNGPQSSDLNPPDKAAAERERLAAQTKEILDLYNQFNTPSHEASDRLNEFLKSVPNHDDYKPGIARAIVAGGLGLGQGGAKVASDYMNEPFTRAMGEWKDKAGPYQQAATLENQQNINERTLSGNVVNSVIAQRKLDEQNRSNMAKEAVAKTRADAYDFKMRNPDWKFDFTGPNVIAVAPDGSQRVSLGPTGHMTDIDKINLQNKGKLDVTNANNVAAGQRNDATITGANTRNAATNATSAANTAANNAGAMARKLVTPEGPLKAGDSAKIRQETFQRLHDTDEVAARWIEIGDDGKTWKLKSLEDDATPAEQYAYANMLTKLYPLTPTPQKKDINLPIEVKGVNSGLGGQDLRQKATDYLKANNLPVTDANIQHAIDTGRVR